MKTFFFSIISFLFFSVQAQNVGIGTVSPHPNAILELASADKALLMPRIADTALVTNPAAGMMIFDQQASKPSFHDGIRWNPVMETNTGTPMYGYMTYTVTGTTVGGIAYETGVLNALDLGYYSFLAFSSGGGGSVGTLMKADSVSLTKEFDGNSIPFKRAHMGGNAIPALEINQFLPNGTKLFSIKLTSFFITSQHTFISQTTGKLTEQYAVSASTIGFKDWVNNKSFSYNVPARTFGAY